eukprot:4261113-Alexandrium_andersonii.AAC.1
MDMQLSILRRAMELRHGFANDVGPTRARARATRACEMPSYDGGALFDLTRARERRAGDARRACECPRAR